MSPTIRRLTRPLTVRRIAGWLCLIAGTLSLLGFLAVWSFNIWTAYTLPMTVLSAATVLYLAFWGIYRSSGTVRAVCKRVRGWVTR